MQNAKDMFYVALRDRLAAVNADRTAVVRGQLRPAVVVCENEMPAATEDASVFYLRWRDRETDCTHGAPLSIAVCEIAFHVAAEPQRGRELEQMCAEINAMLSPAFAVKKRFAEDGSVAMQTNVFWSASGECKREEKAGLLRCVQRVAVMSYVEDGDA